jgi:hypothetical protein
MVYCNQQGVISECPPRGGLLLVDSKFTFVGQCGTAYKT